VSVAWQGRVNKNDVHR